MESATEAAAKAEFDGSMFLSDSFKPDSWLRIQKHHKICVGWPACVRKLRCTMMYFRTVSVVLACMIEKHYSSISNNLMLILIIPNHSVYFYVVDACFSCWGASLELSGWIWGV